MRRLDSAGGVRIEIEEIQTEPKTNEPLSFPIMPGRNPLPWIFVAALSVVVIALTIPTVRYLRQTSTDAPEMRVEISTPSTPAPLDFALSPDGRYIVFVASSDGAQRLWLRALDKTEAQPMFGTDGAFYPFWSPDSHSIGFTASGMLKRIDIGTGQPQVIAPTGVNRGGTWNAEGTILFNTNVGPLFRVSALEASPFLPLGSNRPIRMPIRTRNFYPMAATISTTGMELRKGRVFT
jgi:hypothetical protein